MIKLTFTCCKHVVHESGEANEMERLAMALILETRKRGLRGMLAINAIDSRVAYLKRVA